MAATRRENSPGFTVGEPLNSMCSSTWATPETPSTSSMEPTRNQTMCTAVGALGSALTMTRMPLAKVNSCKLCAKAARDCSAVPINKTPLKKWRSTNEKWGFIE